MKRSVTCTVLCLLPFVALAQSWPAKPIRIVVPYPPGGSTDLVSRLASVKMAAALGQPIVVDNRAGGNSVIGADIVVHAAPDGYTLMFTTPATVTQVPAMSIKPPYDALRDFTPISHICNSGGLVIVVHPSFGAKTLQQLIDMARASPGKIAYGSAGFGNSTHLAAELFQMMAGVKFIHVPYKGAGPAVTDLLGGQIPLMFGPSPVVVPMVQAGRLRPLAFTGLKRSAQLPDVPTVDEAGLKGYENSGWYGMYGPRGTPKDVVARINAAIRQIVQMPDTRERFAALNLEAIGSTPEEFARFLREDLQKYAAIAKAAGIKPE